MKRLFLVILLFLTFYPVFSQKQNDFEGFKTGKFAYEGRESEVEIIRTKRKQIEIYNGGQSKLIMAIKWINDSTYVLTLKRSVNVLGCLENGDSIKTTILKRDGDKYFCSFTSNKCGGGSCVFIKLE